MEPPAPEGRAIAVHVRANYFSFFTVAEAEAGHVVSAQSRARVIAAASGRGDAVYAAAPQDRRGIAVAPHAEPRGSLARSVPPRRGHRRGRRPPRYRCPIRVPLHRRVRPERRLPRLPHNPASPFGPRVARRGARLVFGRDLPPSRRTRREHRKARDGTERPGIEPGNSRSFGLGGDESGIARIGTDHSAVGPNDSALDSHVRSVSGIGTRVSGDGGARVSDATSDARSTSRPAVRESAGRSPLTPPLSPFGERESGPEIRAATPGRASPLPATREEAG